MRYYIKSKYFRIKEDFWVKNDRGQDVYFVDKEFFSFGLQFRVLENNNLRYKVKEKLLRFLPSYEIFDDNERLVGIVNKKFTFLRDSISVESNYGDFQIEGDYFHYNYRINHNGRVVANISKEYISFSDNYCVDIDFHNPPFLIALTIIIDNIIDKHNNN